MSKLISNKLSIKILHIMEIKGKQLEKVLLSINHFIGSIKVLAGPSIPQLKEIGASDNILELPGNE
jgi:hypothetical protein